MTPNRRRHPCHDLTYLLPYTKISPFPSKPRPVGLDSFFYIPQCMYAFWCTTTTIYNHPPFMCYLIVNPMHEYSTFFTWSKENKMIMADWWSKIFMVLKLLWQTSISKRPTTNTNFSLIKLNFSSLWMHWWKEIFHCCCFLLNNICISTVVSRN